MIFFSTNYLEIYEVLIIAIKNILMRKWSISSMSRINMYDKHIKNI